VRVHGISQERDDREKQKEYSVENEKDIREYVEPASVIWYLVK
jgi:hypothetical protein